MFHVGNHFQRCGNLTQVALPAVVEQKLYAKIFDIPFLLVNFPCQAELFCRFRIAFHKGGSDGTLFAHGAHANHFCVQEPAACH